MTSFPTLKVSQSVQLRLSRDAIENVLVLELLCLSCSLVSLLSHLESNITVTSFESQFRKWIPM